ncbi:MAG: hypothetical protein HOO98_18770 [Nitrospira sp.]|nr:hypothetical protein [Nitrospira sp.]
MTKVNNDAAIHRRSLFDLPPWLLGLTLLVLVGVVGLLYISGTHFECGASGPKFTCGFTKATRYEEKPFHGYYYTLDDHGQTTCGHERINVRFFEDNITLEAFAEGTVHDRNGSQVNRTWTYKGFRHGNDLALAYVTADKLPTGNGIYYLLSRGGDYAGYWMGIDFPTDVKVQCPYVLTQAEKRGNETCEKLWPNVFNKQCVQIQG